MNPPPVGTLWADATGRQWQVVANAREDGTDAPVVVYRDREYACRTLPLAEFLARFARAEVVAWLASANQSDAAELLQLLAGYCLVLLARDDWHLRSAASMAGEIGRLRARVAELESGTAAGQHYRCGCPVRTTNKVKLFCDTHFKTIAEETPP